MSSSPLSSLSVTSSSPLSSSAGGPVVSTVHACARHPLLRGERGCAGCSAALCSACARSVAHKHCPDCRQQQGKPAHVVDAGWRITLILDAMAASLKAIPRRAPALLAILAVSLLAPLGIYALADEQSPDWTDAAALAGAFGFCAFALGAFIQPLIVVPLLGRSSKVRVIAGAFIGCVVAFTPFFALGAVAAMAHELLHIDEEIIGNLIGFAVLAVGAVSIPIGLVWQGRAVMDLGPSFKGTFGAVVAHFCVAGAWSMVLSFAWIPVGVAVLVGVVASPVVGGVVGVVCGLVLWLGLLLGMGSFAAASARCSEDLRQLV